MNIRTWLMNGNSIMTAQHANKYPFYSAEQKELTEQFLKSNYGIRELFYDETAVIHESVKTVFDSMFYTLNTLFKSMHFEYEPFKQLDYTETGDGSNNSNKSENWSGSDSSRNSGTDTRTSNQSIKEDVTATDETVNEGTDVKNITSNNISTSTGNNVTVNSGTDKTENSGTDTKINEIVSNEKLSGEDKTETDNTATTTNNINNTATEAKATYDNLALNTVAKNTVNNEDSVNSNSRGDSTVIYGKMSERSEDNTETTEHGLSVTQTHGLTVSNKQDSENETTVNSKDEMIHGLKVTGKHDNTRENTINGTDSTDYGMSNTINYGRSTSGTDNSTYNNSRQIKGINGIDYEGIIRKEREIAEINFIEIIAKAIADNISYMCYDFD